MWFDGKNNSNKIYDTSFLSNKSRLNNNLLTLLHLSKNILLTPLLGRGEGTRKERCEHGMHTLRKTWGIERRTRQYFRWGFSVEISRDHDFLCIAYLPISSFFFNSSFSTSSQYKHVEKVYTYIIHEKQWDFQKKIFDRNFVNFFLLSLKLLDRINTLFVITIAVHTLMAKKQCLL